MKVDPLIRLALAIFENPGTFAPLIGSGVSRGAGVPTGWEVVLDLIRKIAAAAGENDVGDPEAWYRHKFGTDPDYAKVVKQLGATPAERRSLLASYFEPTDEEREQGIKVPAEAHNAIARLAKAGYVRILLTTNFDRLLEEALNAEGVAYDVIASADAMKGATPYVHGGCIVVKLHGDYRDARIRNTAGELARYPATLSSFLDRILDEFGLLVCGWSATYDVALRDAICGCSTRRYTTFWLMRGDPTDEAVELIRSRRAEIIKIASADDFFPRLYEAILSLAEGAHPHPISVPVAVATTKRYLADLRHRIALHDLVNEETEQVYHRVVTEPVLNANTLTQDGFVARMRRYEGASEKLCAILAAIAYHDTGDHARLVTRTIIRLAGFEKGRGIAEILACYPALLAVYSVGIAAMANDNYHNVSAALHDPSVRDFYAEESRPALYRVNVWSVFDNQLYKWVPRPQEREYTPVSNHILDRLRGILSEYIPGNEDYEELFDLFEYLMALTYGDIVRDGWFPPLRYWWRWRHRHRPPSGDFVQRIVDEGNSSPLLKAGFFGGSVDRLTTVVALHDQFLRERNNWS